MVKKSIPKALREQVWLRQFGKTFEAKCPISWCSNTITAFNFHCGHNQPESKSGKTTLENLIPICSNCNLSMNNNYTIDEWNNLDKNVIQVESKGIKIKKKSRAWYCCFLC